MQRLVVAAVVIAFAVAVPTSLHSNLLWAEEVSHLYTFDHFKAQFGRVYEKEEHDRRAAIFKTNLAKINAINSDSKMTWKAAVNKFTDRTTEEMQALKGYNRQLAFANRMPHSAIPSNFSSSDRPASIDWRTKNVVTPTKDQGGCGSCWAFSTAEVLESHIAIQTGKLFTFSEQEFVSCTPNPDQCGGTGGCSGATQWLGFGYAEKAGITTEDNYRYTASDSKCDVSRIKKVATIESHVRLPTNDYEALMNAIANVGPIAISLAADFQFYSHGVFNGHCGWVIDHAVVAVGYGTDAKGGDYWLVRNSWGAGWGEDGYIRIAREPNAASVKCGVDKSPDSGSGCKGGPSEVTVCGLCGILSDSSYPTGGKLI